MIWLDDIEVGPLDLGFDHYTGTAQNANGKHTFSGANGLSNSNCPLQPAQTGGGACKDRNSDSLSVSHKSTSPEEYARNARRLSPAKRGTTTKGCH